MDQRQAQEQTNGAEDGSPTPLTGAPHIEVGQNGQKQHGQGGQVGKHLGGIRASNGDRVALSPGRSHLIESRDFGQGQAGRSHQVDESAQQPASGCDKGEPIPPGIRVADHEPSQRDEEKCDAVVCESETGDEACHGSGATHLNLGYGHTRGGQRRHGEDEVAHLLAPKQPDQKLQQGQRDASGSSSHPSSDQQRHNKRELSRTGTKYRADTTFRVGDEQHRQFVHRLMSLKLCKTGAYPAIRSRSKLARVVH